MICNTTSFYGELLTPRSTSKLEKHPLSAVHDCLLNIFTATPHIGGLTSIRNLRMRHAMVRGTHISRIVNMYIENNSVSLKSYRSLLFHILIIYLNHIYCMYVDT